MSTVIDEPSVVSVPARAGRHSAPAVVALARFEARELFLTIPVFVFFTLYVGSTAWKLLVTRDGMDDFPILQNADRATQSGTMILGIACLICVHVAALRSRRHGTDRHFDILVMEPWRRTVAHVLSVVPFAAVTAVVAAVEYGWAALKPGAVGHGSMAELAVAPLVVLLCGALGVLIARLYASLAGGPLFVVVGFATFMVASSVTGGRVHWLNWLQPVFTEDGSSPVPSDVLGRPAAWHALYLAGLTALMLCLAVLLSGGRTRMLKALTIVALGATATGIAGQSPSHGAALTTARAQLSRMPQTVQSCVAHGRSTYCSFPEWTAWRDDWARVVDRVQDLAGGSAGGARLTIRQRIPVLYDLSTDSAIAPLRTPGEVTVGTRWGGSRVPEFAVGVASVLVAGDEEAVSGMCDARVVTVMWLALAAQDDPMAALRTVRLDGGANGSAVVMTPTEPLSMSAEQARIVRELLRRPLHSVTARVKAHWTELTSPTTSQARVAELLGVPPARGAGKGETCE
ncbi:ABC transporter permease [Streptomyces chiangmaiensis]|uniref:ABC transporter permease n=1 Tax=Streptomyces chiangmaiensis TaxID=766497 RepID=A0ABU7FEM5_9ACTN|nr:ABC transporter permease [Streptomyces chiangmaiensis]MED7822523.1 ABC transporter permease [Streptomyces chiangmaiensis]